jgi:hypothetical protein
MAAAATPVVAAMAAAGIQGAVSMMAEVVTRVAVKATAAEAAGIQAVVVATAAGVEAAMVGANITAPEVMAISSGRSGILEPWGAHFER